jgi:hypothetical protein
MAGARSPEQLGAVRPLTLADVLGTDSDDANGAARRLAAESFGIPIHEVSADVRLEQVAYPFGSPATGGLVRLVGTRADGTVWSLFCKLIQHVRHWPMLAVIPPHIAGLFLETFPWRQELELWDDLTQATLPTGLRSPLLYRILDLGDDRLAVWMEDVEETPTPWDLTTFGRAAELLGRWNARSSTPDVLAAYPVPVNYGIRQYAENAVHDRGLVPLADDNLWGHPWLCDHADLRTSLRKLADQITCILDRTGAMQVAVPHGDASPQNLLRPAACPDTFVAIDVSFHAPHALGFDLGQLLVGGAHASLIPVAELPAIADVILPSYVEGLRAEGINADIDDVRYAFAGYLLIRSGFDGFLYTLLSHDLEDEGARQAFDARIDLARFICDYAVAAGIGTWS